MGGGSGRDSGLVLTERDRHECGPVGGKQNRIEQKRMNIRDLKR